MNLLVLSRANHVIWSTTRTSFAKFDREGYFGEHYAKFVTFRYNGVVFPADWSSKATWEAFYSKVQFSTKFLYLHQVSEDEVIACLELTVENKKTKGTTHSYPICSRFL